MQSMRLVNPGAPRLAVMFPPWHGGSWPYQALVKRLVKQNWAVMDNTFSGEILKPDASQVLASFNNIQATVTDELRRVVDEERYESIHLIGLSIGNAALALVASAYGEFTGATMITPGSSLAECVWDGIRTQHIREGLEHQYSRTTLNEEWQTLAPIEYAPCFTGLPVNLVISTSDEIIPASSQKEFAGALAETGAYTSVTSTSLGHVATIARFCARGRIGNY